MTLLLFHLLKLFNDCFQTVVLLFQGFDSSIDLPIPAVEFPAKKEYSQ